MPIFLNFKKILKNRQFVGYTVAGALSLAGIFVFVSTAPSIFFGEFKVSSKAFTALFGFLVAGLIGGSQLNHLLIKRIGSSRAFRYAISLQVLVSATFLVGACFHAYSVVVTGMFLFAVLGCCGVAAPNAEALALSSFSKNIGSAASLLGFLQEGLGGGIAATLGLLDSRGSVPTASVIFGASIIGLAVIFNMGERAVKAH
jgi:DHA1 family bicyclomycin/chloramphenicol resistance-like MFS transporter